MKGIERAKEFLEMYKEGKTHREIGIKYNISNVRVSVELHKYFPEIKEITKNRCWYVGKRKPAKEYSIFECKWCGKKQPSKYRYYTPKFCSKECRGEFIKKAFK
jgi:hypothetical protein